MNPELKVDGLIRLMEEIAGERFRYFKSKFSVQMTFLVMTR